MQDMTNSFDFEHFAEIQQDFLKEITNIGAGHAATSLSMLLNETITMEVPSVDFMAFESIADRFGGFEQAVVAIFLRFNGSIPGNMFFIITPDGAKRLLRGLVSMIGSSEHGFSEMEQSALSEIGNLLASGYLIALNQFTQLEMQPSVPSFAYDMAGAILTVGYLQYSEMGDKALLVDTTFTIGDEKIESHFFLIPDPQSFEPLFHALGVMRND
jgi:chemotaxis protein CheC